MRSDPFRPRTRPSAPAPPGRTATALAALALSLAAAGAGCAQEPDDPAAARERMVREQLARPPSPRTPVRDTSVLAALRAVPRHRFVPAPLRGLAYADRPLPIGEGQTISQPYIVARMTELLEVEPGEKVLEVGTGSGYQAAVLAEITDSVYSVEIVGELARSARRRLERLGYGRVRVRHGDGYRGWPEHAPFDAVIVTAAPEEIPPPLVEQLAPGGRMVLPRGPEGGPQVLTLVTKDAGGRVRTQALSGVRFVPMTRDTGETAGGGGRPETEGP